MGKSHRGQAIRSQQLIDAIEIGQELLVLVVPSNRNQWHGTGQSRYRGMEARR